MTVSIRSGFISSKPIPTNISSCFDVFTEGSWCVGKIDGEAEGRLLGFPVGGEVGYDESVGMVDGIIVNVGIADGSSDNVGIVDGSNDGTAEGTGVGSELGRKDGDNVGNILGNELGDELGWEDGDKLG